MSKFNQKNESNLCYSYEGGKLHKKDILSDWMNFLFSSFLSDQFYESDQEQIQRFQELTKNIIEKYGPEFAAKACIFARKELGMRSSTALVAAMLNDYSFDNKRHFFAKVANRPDDVAEIFAAIDKVCGSKRSHAAVRGLGDYISSLGEYQLGKYKLNGKAYNMFDIINITHANSNAINKYKKGILESPDTWEVKISTSDDKQAEWRRLVIEDKLGYIALIRNLNNIIESALSENADMFIKKYLLPQLTNENKIRKSLVFPYQIYCAYRNFHYDSDIITKALEKAFVISCKNMPEFNGNSAIALDVSGSMEAPITRMGLIKLKEVGACYGVALWLRNHNSNTKLIKFGNIAKVCDLNPYNGIFENIETFAKNSNCGYGTDVCAIFEDVIHESFNRIFIISDMQTMDVKAGTWYSDCKAPYTIDAVQKYRQEYNDNVQIYSFDLSNYSGSVVNTSEDNIHMLTALNDKVISMIPFIETKSQSMFDIINNYSY